MKWWETWFWDNLFLFFLLLNLRWAQLCVSLVLLQSDGPNTPNRVFTGVGGGGVQFEWNITRVVQVFHKRGNVPFIVKGILHQKNFYRLNLIFWIVMGWDLEGQREMINHWSLLSVALPLETPWRCPSKPHGAVPRNPRCAAPQNPWGQNLRPKLSSFGGF